jgi:hypothetical protein
MSSEQPNIRLHTVVRRAGLSNEALARRVVDVAAENGFEAAYNHISVRHGLPAGPCPQRSRSHRRRPGGCGRQPVGRLAVGCQRCLA